MSSGHMAVKSPREAGKFISSWAQHVSIKREGIQKTAKLIYPELENSFHSVKSWRKHELHPKELNEETINWIFLLDTLNFSFWVDEGTQPFVVKYHGKCYTGYWALCAAINRALKNGIPITTPSYYALITQEELKVIFHSETPTEIPLLEERVKNLNETGKILVEKYQNTFLSILKSCNKSAKALLRLVVSQFSCFRDETVYRGQKVGFYKRAQILIGDIWACFEGQGFGEFKDIDSLTMFADYLVPRGLQFLDVIEYSNELQNKLESGKLLPVGSVFEVEIRGCSIWAVELIRKELHRMQEERIREDGDCNKVVINAILVDFFLWDYTKAQEDQLGDFLMHKTRSIFY